MADLLSSIPDAVIRKLDDIASQYAQLDSKLSDPTVLADHRAVRSLSIKKSSMEPVVRDYEEFRRLARESSELRHVIDGAGSSASPADREYVELAKSELPGVEAKAREVLEGIKSALVNAEDRRVGSVMLEVRAGTGGDEASLWARDLLEMYQRLASRRKWAFEMLDMSAEGSVGGVRHAVANVRGEGVWLELNFEAGVHSVKRVPATETQGRIHTSTATVAVLPEPEEVDIKIDWAADVKEDVTTAQGPGGQNVNKVATAVKLLHIATGIEVRMQESKSQQQNREKARRLMMARLYELERAKKHAERSAARNSQIGAGDRSEKIRTYRYKEGIIADERLPGQYNLRDILSGDMDTLLHDLVELETSQRLAAL
ncbi:MAG: PCRF domain-containing protein [Pyrinomonadaceae bacterium]|nr:PCRF domain-containing protein [Phycisphaerales bacterium]